MWAQQEQCSPARIVSGAGRLKSPGNQGRRIGEGWDIFFSKAASKGLPRPFNATGWRCSNNTKYNPTRNIIFGVLIGSLVIAGFG